MAFLLKLMTPRQTAAAPKSSLPVVDVRLAAQWPIHTVDLIKVGRFDG
jgi:hypothetical protein